MSTLIFSIQEADLDEISDLRMLLNALPQNEIDLQSIEHGANYEKLYHIRSLRLEELTSQLQLEGALSDSYLELLRAISNVDSETKANIRFASSYYLAAGILRSNAGMQSLANLIGMGTHPNLLKRNLLFGRSSTQSIGVVEISDPTEGCDFSGTSFPDVKPNFEDIPPSTTRVSKGQNTEENATVILGTALDKALKGKVEPVNLGIYPHILITEALNRFIYAETGTSPVSLPIAYSDGSEARPFPFFSLSQPPAPPWFWAGLEIMKVGMVSARHPEMDHLIDFYWFRNQMVSVNRAEAQTDEVAYLWTKELLAKARNQKLKIAFYQTGFPPVLIGFYRALVEELLLTRKEGDFRLQVTPYFYNKKADDYLPGNSWS